MIRLTLALCGVLAALTALPMAAHSMETAAMSQPDEQRLAQLRNTNWRVTQERLQGLTGPGEVLLVGATVYLENPPPIEAIRAGLRPVGDPAGEGLEVDNLKALLAEARGDRNRASQERDAARVELRGLEAQVRADGDAIARLHDELTAARDGRAFAEAEVQRLTAELDRRPPALTVAEQLEQIHPTTLLAAVNERRATLELEPIGGAGAGERARTWVLADAPDLAEQLALQRV